MGFIMLRHVPSVPFLVYQMFIINGCWILSNVFLHLLGWSCGSCLSFCGSVHKSSCYLDAVSTLSSRGRPDWLNHPTSPTTSYCDWSAGGNDPVGADESETWLFVQLLGKTFSFLLHIEHRGCKTWDCCKHLLTTRGEPILELSQHTEGKKVELSWEAERIGL